MHAARLRRLGTFAVVAVLWAAPGAEASRPLLVGVGRADITPLTNVYKGGWACTCALAIGQHERLYARAIALKQGRFQVALVTEDLFALSAGMVRDAAALTKRLGFTEANIIDSATHSVLRIDQDTRHGRRPLGIYSTFANPGTVDHVNFWYYSGDHQGAAERVVEAAIRRAGHVPSGQDVINAFANGDAGDMTSGI